jgi:hypothetical protein
MLSVKSSSLVQRCREAVAESFLSVKASPREKTRSARVTSPSAKGLNPVVISRASAYYYLVYLVGATQICAWRECPAALAISFVHHGIGEEL